MSSPTPSRPEPTRKGSLRSRMGGMLKRSSSAISAANAFKSAGRDRASMESERGVSSPPAIASSDPVSAHSRSHSRNTSRQGSPKGGSPSASTHDLRVDPSAAIPPHVARALQAAPSPIAESPAREAAANVEEANKSRAPFRVPEQRIEPISPDTATSPYVVVGPNGQRQASQAFPEPPTSQPVPPVPQPEPSQAVPQPEPRAPTPEFRHEPPMPEPHVAPVMSASPEAVPERLPTPKPVQMPMPEATPAPPPAAVAAQGPASVPVETPASPPAVAPAPVPEPVPVHSPKPVRSEDDAARSIQRAWRARSTSPPPPLPATVQARPFLPRQPSDEEHDAARRIQQAWRSRPSSPEPAFSAPVPSATLPPYQEGSSSRGYLVDKRAPALSTIPSQDVWTDPFGDTAQSSTAVSVPEPVPTFSKNGQADAAERAQAALAIQRAWRASRSNTSRSLPRSNSKGKTAPPPPMPIPQPSGGAHSSNGFKYHNGNTNERTPLLRASVTEPESEGWKALSVPNGTKYYYHPQRHSVADVWPVSLTTLAPPGWEVYLPRSGSPRYVNHARRIVVKSFPLVQGEAESHDAEIAYWDFLASHPMHSPLPAGAAEEAEAVLAWAHADSAMASSSVRPPFTRGEAEEISASLAAVKGPAKIRLVSRILHRLAQSKAQHTRSDGPSLLRRIPAAILEILIGALLLGIPFVIELRTRTRRDIESLGLHSPAPALMVGACTCLVAAIILSSAVAFVTIPGIDVAARTAAIVAVIFSVSSMASTVLSILRYKLDLSRSPAILGGEGIFLISRRSVVLSLPLAMLGWAVTAFVVAFVLHMTRVLPPMHEAQFYTLVGVVGGVAGVLIVGALCLHQ